MLCPSQYFFLETNVCTTTFSLPSPTNISTLTDIQIICIRNCFQVLICLYLVSSNPFTRPLLTATPTVWWHSIMCRSHTFLHLWSYYITIFISFSTMTTTYRSTHTHKCVWVCVYIFNTPFPDSLLSSVMEVHLRKWMHRMYTLGYCFKNNYKN